MRAVLVRSSATASSTRPRRKGPVADTPGATAFAAGSGRDRHASPAAPAARRAPEYRAANRGLAPCTGSLCPPEHPPPTSKGSNLDRKRGVSSPQAPTPVPQEHAGRGVRLLSRRAAAAFRRALWRPTTSPRRGGVSRRRASGRAPSGDLCPRSRYTPARAAQRSAEAGITRKAICRLFVIVRRVVQVRLDGCLGTSQPARDLGDGSVLLVAIVPASAAARRRSLTRSRIWYLRVDRRSSCRCWHSGMLSDVLDNLGAQRVVTLASRSPSRSVVRGPADLTFRQAARGVAVFTTFDCVR